MASFAVKLISCFILFTGVCSNYDRVKNASKYLFASLAL